MSAPLAQPPEKYEQRWMFLLWKRVIGQADNAEAITASQIFSRKEPPAQASIADAQTIIANRIFGG